MKAFIYSFLYSLALVAGLSLLASLIVFPLFPSDVPVLLLLLVSMVLLFQRLRPSSQSDQSGQWSLKSVIVPVIVGLASIGLILVDSGPQGPMFAATALLYLILLSRDKRRVSILAGVLILAVLWMSSYLICQWLSGFLDFYYEGFLLGLPACLVAAAWLRTASLSGVKEGDQRSWGQSIFPVKAGWRQKEATLVSLGLLGMSSFLFNSGHEQSRSELQQLERNEVEARSDLREMKYVEKDLENFERMVHIKERELNRLENQVGYEESQDQWLSDIAKSAQAQGIIVVNQFYFETEKSHVSKDGLFIFGPSKLNLVIRGDFDKVLDFIGNNYSGPGTGAITSIIIKATDHNQIIATIQWRSIVSKSRVNDKPQPYSRKPRSPKISNDSGKYISLSNESNDIFEATDLSAIGHSSEFSWNRRYHDSEIAKMHHELERYNEVAKKVEEFKIKIDRITRKLELLDQIKSERENFWTPELCAVLIDKLIEIVNSNEAKGLSFKSLDLAGKDLVKLHMYDPKAEGITSQSFEMKAPASSNPSGSQQIAEPEPTSPEKPAASEQETQVAPSDTTSPKKHDSSQKAHKKPVAYQYTEEKPLPQPVTKVFISVWIYPEPKYNYFSGDFAKTGGAQPALQYLGETDGKKQWRILALDKAGGP